MFIDDFRTNDLVYFNDDFGIAIDIDRRRLLIFEKNVLQRERSGWAHEDMPLSDFLGAREQVMEAGRFLSGGTRHVGLTGAAEAIGGGLAASVENARARARAREETGIELQFRSVSRPILFLKVEFADVRARLFEALRQVLEDGEMKEAYRVIPRAVDRAYHRPTQAEMAEGEAANLRWSDLPAAAFLALLFVGLLYTFAEAALPLWLHTDTSLVLFHVPLGLLLSYLALRRIKRSLHRWRHRRSA
ncbi:hypothetical protein [Rhodobacter sp. NSM]|uniref:hypothetical protein n=1 Tax=Rhodobacter sp. NSM TaxID=3457501 RepID=UPI003FCFE483